MKLLLEKTRDNVAQDLSAAKGANEVPNAVIKGMHQAFQLST